MLTYILEPSVEKVIVLVAVALAALFIARRALRFLNRAGGDTAGCGGCGCGKRADARPGTRAPAGSAEPTPDTSSSKEPATRR